MSNITRPVPNLLSRNKKMTTGYILLKISVLEIVHGDEGLDGKNHECQERHDDGAVHHLWRRIAPPAVVLSLLLEHLQYKSNKQFSIGLSLQRFKN